MLVGLMGRYALMWSGGKDSALALQRATHNGVAVTRLINFFDATTGRVRFHATRADMIRAQAVAAFLQSQPALCDYLGRALAEGTEASAELFHRLFLFAARDERLIAAGALRAGTDPFWRAMNQVILIVGPLLLRPLVERELGGELLSHENVTSWMRARTELLQRGLYTESDTTVPHGALPD